jgi:hypothetical protein
MTTCRSDQCSQGDRQCPTPEVCADKPLDLAASVRYLSGYLSVFLRWRDHKAAKYAGHLAAIAKPQPKPPKERRIDPQAVVIFLACIATWVGVYLASVWPLH